jgi:multisubunit Na+/H+ antiporter MnhE subunit
MAWRRVVTAWLAVWLACFALWLLLTSTVDHTELLTGAGVAAIAATIFEVVREHGAPRARPRWRWLTPAPIIPLLVMRDTGVVFAELVRQLRGGRRRPGRLQVLPLPDIGDEAERSARHLFVTIGVALSPNTYIIGFEPDRNEMLVHQLVPKRPGSVDELFSL